MEPVPQTRNVRYPVKLNTTYRFLRPTMLVFLCFCIAVLGSWWISPRRASISNDELLPLEEVSSTIGSLVHPHPSIAVQDVVRIQLDGLANQSSSEGILQCMTFASPGNRLVTGPLERFGRMVRSERFRVLASPDRVLIGEPTFIDGNARVLVTLVNQRQLSSFVWVLSKQDEAPFDGCWMTDGVFPLDMGQRGDSPVPTENEVI